MVVCIDDDKEDADIVREVLDSSGVSSVWYQDGIDFFGPSGFSPESVQFILLDIDMPIRDGFDILSMIRDSTVWSNTPTIIFSGSASHRDVTRAFLAGATFYLQKPAVFSDLAESVRFLLGVDWKRFSPTLETFVYRTPGSA